MPGQPVRGRFTDADANCNSNSYSNSYSYSNSDLNADSNSGETITYGEASAINTAAETIAGNITN